MILLSNLNNGITSLFGDVRYIGKYYMIISICGASSIYYACHSCNTCNILNNITIEANCVSISGWAVDYNCPPDEIAVTRLVRSMG